MQIPKISTRINFGMPFADDIEEAKVRQRIHKKSRKTEEEGLRLLKEIRYNTPHNNIFYHYPGTLYAVGKNYKDSKGVEQKAKSFIVEIYPWTGINKGLKTLLKRADKENKRILKETK